MAFEPFTVLSTSIIVDGVKVAVLEGPAPLELREELALARAAPGVSICSSSSSDES